jgi:hypothetical protein
LARESIGFLTQSGRCWHERGERRVILGEPRDSYGYGPRERYIEHRGYDDRGGIGFRAPGVSVGIGTDRYQTEEKVIANWAAEQTAAFSGDLGAAAITNVRG